MLEYGDADQILSEEQKQFANTYIECQVDIEEIKFKETDNPVGHMGSFAFGVYYLTSIQVLNPTTECIGTLLDVSKT